MRKLVFRYSIVRSKRRTIALVISPDAALTVRAPRHLALDYIEKLVKEKSAWIIRKTKEIQSRPKVKPKEFVNKEQYKKEARQKIEERVAWYAGQMGVQYQSIRISNAEKCLGSCSYKGSLSFSWKLILAPMQVLDYVVAHELAHLIEHNHSPRFWQKVEMIFPEHRQARKWLKDNRLA